MKNLNWLWRSATCGVVAAQILGCTAAPAPLPNADHSGSGPGATGAALTGVEVIEFKLLTEGLEPLACDADSGAHVRSPAIQAVVQCGDEKTTRCVGGFIGDGGHVRLTLPIGSCRKPQLIEVTASAAGSKAEALVVEARAIRFEAAEQDAPLAGVQPPQQHLATPIPWQCEALPCGVDLNIQPLGDAGAAFEIRAYAPDGPVTAVTLHLDPWRSTLKMAKEEPDQCELPQGAWADGHLSAGAKVPVQVIWIDGFTARHRIDSGSAAKGVEWKTTGEPASEARLSTMRWLLGDDSAKPSVATQRLDERLDRALPIEGADYELRPLSRRSALGDFDPVSPQLWQPCSDVSPAVRENARRVIDAQTKFPVAYESGAINVYVVDSLVPLEGVFPPAPYGPGDRGLAGFAFFPGFCCASAPPLIVVSRSIAGSSPPLEQIDALVRLIAHEIGHLGGLNHIRGEGDGGQVAVPETEILHRHSTEEVVYDYAFGTDGLGFAAPMQALALFAPLRNLMAGWDASTGVVVDTEQSECLRTSLRSKDGYLRNALALNVKSLEGLDKLGVPTIDNPDACIPEADRSGPQTDDGCDELVAFENPNLSALLTSWSSQPLTITAAGGGHAWNPGAQLALRTVAVSKAPTSATSQRALATTSGATGSLAFGLVQGGDNHLAYGPGSYPLAAGEEIIAVLVGHAVGGAPPPAPERLSWAWVQRQWDQLDVSKCQPTSYPPHQFTVPPQSASALVGAAGFDGHNALTANIWGCPPAAPTGVVRVDQNWSLVWLIGPHGPGM